MTILKEEIKKEIKIGWYSLIEKVYNAQELAFYAGVECIERRNGMLFVRYVRTPDSTDYQNFVLTCLEYKIERLSALLCEGCGANGRRRKDLSEIQSLCTSCYALAYSEIHDSVPSLVANLHPQYDEDI